MSEKDWDKLTSGAKELSVRAGDIVVRQGVREHEDPKKIRRKNPIFWLFWKNF
jgi:hypothetical protein